MSNEPLVSFCMSTYKRPAILKVQLEKILQQEYQNFEIVISDNDEEGSARKIVEDISDKRLKYYHNSVNLGMVKSFNKSIERSRGDYIVMVTDDDPVYESMLSVLVDLRNNNPGYGVYAGCGDLIIENEFSSFTLQRSVGINSTILKNIPADFVIKFSSDDAPTKYLDGFFSKTYLLWSCCIVEREVIKSIKGMPDYDSEFLTDHAFMITASSKKGLLFINKSLGGQEIRGDNFGFAFDKLKEKYIKTPRLFHDFVSSHLKSKKNWPEVQKKLWDFIGRAWVEYSLMIYKSIIATRLPLDEFRRYYKIAFNEPHLRKWSYKFYLKAHFRPIFNVLIKIKNIF